MIEIVFNESNSVEMLTLHSSPGYCQWNPSSVYRRRAKKRFNYFVDDFDKKDQDFELSRKKHKTNSRKLSTYRDSVRGMGSPYARHKQYFQFN